MEQCCGGRPDETWEWLHAVADPVRLHILMSLLGTADATAVDLAGGLASPQTLRRHLEALVSIGVVAESPGASDGETPGRPAARFRLDPSVRDSVSALVSPPVADLGGALSALS
jgi:predicted ArsR family transcriptional regulator